MGEVSLVRYDAACKALADAKSFDEVKEIRDKAEAMRAYARQAKNKSLEFDAASLRIRAERELGKMLQKTEKAKPGPYSKPGGRSVKRADRSAATLKEIGISKDLSARSRKLAAVPDVVFEGKIADLGRKVREEGERVTTDLLKIGADKQRESEARESEGRIELILPLAEYQVWVEAAKRSKATLTEWVRQRVNASLPVDMVPSEPTERRGKVKHDTKSCRLYGCLQCQAAGVTNSKRGLL